MNRVTHSLNDLAASSAQAANMAKWTDETIEDDDGPSHCYFQTTINNTLDWLWLSWMWEGVPWVMTWSKIFIRLGKAKICLCVQIGHVQQLYNHVSIRHIDAGRRWRINRGVNGSEKIRKQCRKIINRAPLDTELCWIRREILSHCQFLILVTR